MLIQRPLFSRIQRIDPAQPVANDAPLGIALLKGADDESTGIQAHGAWLTEVGLPLPRVGAESVLVYRVSAAALSSPCG